MKKALKRCLISAYIVMTLSLGIVYAATSGTLGYLGSIWIQHYDPTAVTFQMMPVTNAQNYYFSATMPGVLDLTEEAWLGTTFSLNLLKSGAGGNNAPSLYIELINTTTKAWVYCGTNRANIASQTIATPVAGGSGPWSNGNVYVTTGQAQPIFQNPATVRVFTYADNEGHPAQGSVSANGTAPIIIYPNQRAGIVIAFNGQPRPTFSETFWFNVFFKPHNIVYNATPQNPNAPTTLGTEITEADLSRFSFVGLMAGTNALPANPAGNAVPSGLSPAYTFWWKKNLTNSANTVYNTVNDYGFEYPWEV